MNGLTEENEKGDGEQRGGKRGEELAAAGGLTWGKGISHF